MNNIETVTLIYDNLSAKQQPDCYKVKLLNNTDSIFVPLDSANTDYQAIQEWVAIEGNEIIDNPPSE